MGKQRNQVKAEKRSGDSEGEWGGGERGGGVRTSEKSERESEVKRNQQNAAV